MGAGGVGWSRRNIWDQKGWDEAGEMFRIRKDGMGQEGRLGPRRPFVGSGAAAHRAL